MRSALLTLALAILTLLLSLAVLLTVQIQQSGSVAQQQLASELAITVEQLGSLVDSDSTDWSQSDELAQLIAVADVQMKSVKDSTDSGLLDRLPGVKSLDTAAQEINTAWMLLREELLAPAPENQTPPAEPVVTVSGDYQALATDFTVIRTRVFEGSHNPELRALVSGIASQWVRMVQNSDANIEAELQQQKTNAKDLLRLSGIESGNALFGYDTRNLIISYVNKVNTLEITTLKPAANLVTAPTEAINRLAPSHSQLQQALKNYNAAAEQRSRQFTRAMWLAIGGFFLSLLLCALAALRMLHTARELANFRKQPTDSIMVHINEANELLDDIETVSDGDLRYPVRVPAHGHSKAIAESVNRSGAVMHNLVTMTRGVAARLNELVAQHDTLSQHLGNKDINRQSQTAELSDAVALRSRLLSEQQTLLKSTAEIAAGIDKQFESAAGTVNGIASSLATASAQVEVGNERMQRLLQTVGNVNKVTGKLKQLAEQTRLQALNVSLRMSVPEAETTHSSDEYGDPVSTSADLGDMHQLTAELVQAANEADVVTDAMRNDISETTQALKTSHSELNESASLTYAATLGGKELTSHVNAIEEKIGAALSNIEQQKQELAQSAERIVSLDKVGNNYSHLTMTLSQDIAELQSMANKLEESVSGFRLREERGTSKKDGLRKKTGRGESTLER